MRESNSFISASSPPPSILHSPTKSQSILKALSKSPPTYFHSNAFKDSLVCNFECNNQVQNRKIAQSKRLSSTDKYYRVFSVHVVFVAHLIFPFVFQICPIYIFIFSVARLIFPFGLPFALHNMSCQGLALDDLFHILQNIPTA